MLSRVTRLLAESGADLSHEELLDALWLARRLPEGAGPLARAARAGAPDPEPPAAPHHATPPSPPADGQAPGPVPATGTHPAPAHGAPAAHEPVRPLLAAAGTHGRDGGGTAPTRAVAVRAPDRRPAAGQLPLGKALRPLRQRFPDRRRHTLDLPRTVAAIADTGLPETVTRPARTGWLSLALVVDDGVSMVLWQRLAADVRTLMERAGAFRDVRVYGLDTRGATPHLRPRPYQDGGRPFAPETLGDPTGHTLVLVVSDGVGAAWHDGGMRRVMERWARCGPTAIVHALPARLWSGTGVPARRRRVTTHRRGGPTAAWHAADPDLPPGLVTHDPVPVPVLAPTPAAIGAWARLLASPGGTALLPLWHSARPRPDAARARRDDEAPAVLRFREAASPEAYRLAAHLAAVAPVTPPVMRLVQTALGPPTDPGHLMEVFLGGLMHQLAADEPDRLPHHRRFDFSDDARRVLLSAVAPKELLRTTDAVTRHIEAAVGRAPVFPAWVGHPDGPALVDGTGRSFGWLRERLLTRLGAPPPPPEPPEPADTPPPGWGPLHADDPVRIGRFRLRARSTRGWPHMAMYLALDEDGTPVTVRTPVPARARNPREARHQLRTEAECLGRMGGVGAPRLVGVRLGAGPDLPWVAASCTLRREDDPSSGPAPNLRAVLEEHAGAVPDELYLRIGRGLCEAVHSAHARGLVHGGLAPRSVLVSDDDVQVVGWMTATVDGVDSPYRADFPVRETYLDDGDDGPARTPASDVYAVGALLLALRVGRWDDTRADARLLTDPAVRGLDRPLADLLRRCLHPDPDRRPSTAQLVEAFTAAREAAARTGEQALAAVDEEVARLRRRARLDPAAYGPDLARGLLAHSRHLAGAGQAEQAVAAAEEAVALCRQQAADGDVTALTELARSLNDLGVRLGEAGRHEASRGAFTEAERICRPLAARYDERHVDVLGAVLTNWSNALAATGGAHQALAAANEAVRHHRTLFARITHEHGPGLARSLTNLASRLAAVGRREEAVAAAEEAVRLYRDMTVHGIGDVWADYAVSLNNFAVRLADVGRVRQARVVVEESADALRMGPRVPPALAAAVTEQSDRIRAWLREAT